MRQILFDQPRVPLGLPDPWAELLPRMLAKRYEDRPTAAEVAARLIDRPTVEPPRPPGLSRGMAKAASRLDPALVPPGALVNEPDGSILAPVPNDGEALLGSEEEEGCPDERPRFRVALPAYYVGLHPVTNAQYKRFVDATGRRAPVSSSAGDSVWNGKECPPELSDHPVVCVSWDDAQAYCSWAGLRLPTELEWEKAARGCDGRRYPWGEEWDAERCRSRRNRGSTGTARVGAYPLGRSPYGVLDMAGNVWEWCADRYDSESYARYAQGDLVPPLVGERRVFRGGSWSGAAYADYCRCAYRGMALASHRHPDLGFRVARSVGP
jgi:formylglycine-generating enzyme required for sulfatase activity